jgi:hypothetical protein
MASEEADPSRIRDYMSTAWRTFGHAVVVAATADSALFYFAARNGQVDGGLAVAEGLNTAAWMTIWLLGDLSSPEMRRIRSLQGIHDEEMQQNPLLTGRFNEVVEELDVYKGKIAGSGSIGFGPDFKRSGPEI